METLTPEAGDVVRAGLHTFDSFGRLIVDNALRGVDLPGRPTTIDAKLHIRPLLNPSAERYCFVICAEVGGFEACVKVCVESD